MSIVGSKSGSRPSDTDLLAAARRGIDQYLDQALQENRIDQQLYADAKAHTYENVELWWNAPRRLQEEISPGMNAGLVAAIQAGKWKDVVDAFRQNVRFGTGGIRGMMAFDFASIKLLKEQGIHAPILKGPNTINDVVLLKTSAGVARFGREQKTPFSKIVIGYDSRIRGHDLAKVVAELFLYYGYTVYFFDAPCPYPEVTFAIPHSSIQADVGILISASHNDYRYNGYKLSCANGSQFDLKSRNQMYDKYIAPAEFDSIHLCSFRDAQDGRLVFLGGAEPVPDYDYGGHDPKWVANHLLNIHEKHLDHVRQFLLMRDLPQQQAGPNPLRIGYCAFHGAGRIAVPRLLHQVGFQDVKPIHRGGLNELNGLFPSFFPEGRSEPEPGKERQPDPGDIRAARTAVKYFREEYPGEFEQTDILVGTDPDADRCGIVVKVPEDQRDLYDGHDYTLLPADDAWTLLLWYRLNREARQGRVVDADRKFIVLSTTTSDAITRIALKHGLGVVKTWVGFAALAAATELVWRGETPSIVGLKEGRGGPDHIGGPPEFLCHGTVCETLAMDNGQRSFNVAAMEQSNGFSLLGGPPRDPRSLGQDGHVRDKDGTLAALLMAEIAAFAKQQGTTLMQLLDQNIYVDPAIGLFANFYEPDPMDGEYPGIEGDRLKKAILRRALGCMQMALAGDLQIGGRPVKSVALYRTGKYDAIYPPTPDFVFPDEGIRFYFDDQRLQHVTVRPSGTGNSLRFHVQLHATPDRHNLVATKRSLRAQGQAILDHLRELLRAPRTDPA